jgi:hypothetical protein
MWFLLWLIPLAFIALTLFVRLFSSTTHLRRSTKRFSPIDNDTSTSSTNSGRSGGSGESEEKEEENDEELRNDNANGPRKSYRARRPSMKLRDKQ